MSPHHRIRVRDEGLRRTARWTGWVFAGSTVVTGGFSVVAAHSFAGTEASSSSTETGQIDPAVEDTTAAVVETPPPAVVTEPTTIAPVVTQPSVEQAPVETPAPTEAPTEAPTVPMTEAPVVTPAPYVAPPAPAPVHKKRHPATTVSGGS